MKKNLLSASDLCGALISAAVVVCSAGLAALAFAAPADAATPGAWSVVPSPSIGRQNTPYAVTCTSPTECWAVGDYWEFPNGYPTPQTLIERWNGTSWSIVPSPNSSSTQTNGLTGVACTSSSDCWAVGSFTYINYDDPVFPRGYSQTLIQHWDGIAWRIVPSPNSSAKESNGLSDVTCTSASDCWAVGTSTYYDNAAISPTFRSQAMIQHWDGSSWKIFPSPAGASLRSVTCVSGNDCWAVGNTLIEHWDGASWKVVPEAGGREGYPNYLDDVTCTSASDCWAVGARSTGPETGETLIEHWNGSSWSIVPSPNPRPDAGALSAVACTSQSQCWAVGSYFDGQADRTIIEQWNGSAWTIVSSPDPSSRSNRLRGVACASGGQCFAVGDQLQSSGQLTLFDIYTPLAQTPTPTPTVTPTPTASPLPTATPTPAPSPTSTPIGSLLGNISTRLRVESGDRALIAGFIVTGTEPKKIIVRGIGSSLPFPDRLADPTLELRDASGSLLVANDNWQDAPNASEIRSSGVAPTDSLESAILTTLPANKSGYTAILRGGNGGTGIGLVEAYDLGQQANSKLANISSRGFVQTGDNVMIGGFFVLNGSRKVIVRAIGPSLGIAEQLQDPTLQLFDSQGNALASNNDWRDTQEAEIAATGIPPSDGRESAIVRTLPPSHYTAIVRGLKGGTGIGLVEVYALD